MTYGTQNLRLIKRLPLAPRRRFGAKHEIFIYKFCLLFKSICEVFRTTERPMVWGACENWKDGKCRLRHFKNRFFLYNFKSQGKNSNIEMISQDTHLKFPKVIEEESYCARKSFNANKARLFWLKMPIHLTMAYITQEKSMSGFNVGCLAFGLVQML